MKKTRIILAIIFNIFSLNIFALNKDTIYLYSDEGAGEISIEHSLYTLNKLYGEKYKIETIKADKVIEGKWVKNAAIFIIPGGADIPYTKKLNGKANEIIKKYVETGGSYLGICAGGYYGSSYVEFDKAGKWEVLGTRELAFFKGKAIGPILAHYDYKTNKGVRIASLKTNINSIKNINLYYNGGSYFENPEKYNNVSILAKYQNKKGKNLPAIIYVKYGKGNAILSGVHLEYDPKLLDKNDKYLSKIIPALEKDNMLRIELIKTLFSRLNLG